MRLHTFSMFGMPRLPPEDRRYWEIGDGGDSGLTMEKSWKELVLGHKVDLKRSMSPEHIRPSSTHAYMYLTSVLGKAKAL